MNFIFICPENQKDFTSENFTVVNNRGINTDADGNKNLDAEVVLNEPCPFCGGMHVYHVSELLCPFEEKT